MRLTPICIALLALTACTRPNPAYDANPELPDSCRTGVETSEKFTAFPDPAKLDILFVVDASGDDPQALQEVFANAVAPIGGALRELDLDVRAAVATTDASAGSLAGPGKSGPDCEGNAKLVADLGEDDWGTTLRCNLFAPMAESRFDQPLAVVDGLLAEPPEGFLREDARLLVVVGTRGDDCSSSSPLTGAPRQVCPTADLDDVQTLVEGWLAAIPTRDALGLAVFAGPPSEVGAAEGRPVCSSTVGSALAANRLFEATTLFGELGYFSSICTDDVFRPLADVITSFAGDATTTICPASELTHEPLEVLAGGQPVPLGEAGFTYLGPTADCANGAIRFASDALRDVDEVEITYCTPE